MLSRRGIGNVALPIGSVTDLNFRVRIQIKKLAVYTFTVLYMYIQTHATCMFHVQVHVIY